MPSMLVFIEVIFTYIFLKELNLE